MPSTSTAPAFRRASERDQQGFSLVEIMVVVALLSVIILGLMAMFNQTQRAFRLGMTQTDVLESGRIATEMIGRELEQMTPSQLPPVNLNAVNFYKEVPAAPPMMLPLLGSSGTARMNVLEDLFFLTRENQTWSGIGYFVRTNGAYLSSRVVIGTLYRFETNAAARQFQNPPAGGGFWSGYRGASNNVSISRVLDGVVHFRVRAYDAAGIEIVTNTAPYFYRTNIYAAPSTMVLGEVNCTFASEAVPAYVELELGILEPQTLERFRSIPNVNNAPQKYLLDQAGRVHVFRQRFPVRNVDPLAYQ